MKVKKRILGLILVSALSTSLVGCKKEEEVKQPDPYAWREDSTEEVEEVEEVKEVKKETIAVTDGYSMSSGECDITFKMGEFSYDVLPDNKNNYYSHYPADPGMVYYQLCLDIKNNNKQNVMIDNILDEYQLVYDDGYEYGGFPVLVATDKSSFDYSNITPIKPLETRGIRLLFSLPEEIEKSEKPVQVNITIGGQTYTYKAR